MEDKKCAVCNTGPMLSVFQSGQVGLLKTLYDKIYVPESALEEYSHHTSKRIIEELIEMGFVESCELDNVEKQVAVGIAQQIAQHRSAKSRDMRDHYPEAEAIVLMGRCELQATEIMLDEQAAREVAKERGIAVVGFAGLLIRACRSGYITAEEARAILLECKAQGTHYATRFIDGIYRKLKENENEG